MITEKKIVLLKLTGDIFKINNDSTNFNYAKKIAQQIKQLKDFTFAIVIGGGNILRGSTETSKFQEISKLTQHLAGTLATYVNGLFLADIFNQENLFCSLISPNPYPGISNSPDFIQVKKMLNNGETLIFVGGTGNPYLSTDTAAVLKALYLQANEIWKLTKVDGIYDKDPLIHKDAKKIQNISYEQIFEQRLKIMDRNALDLAHEHKLTLRFFNVFSDNVLINAASDKQFGSTLK